MRLVLPTLLLSLLSAPAVAEDNLDATLADVPPVLADAMLADPECQPFEELANGEDIEIDRGFDGDKTLYILPCWSGAYNFGWKAFVEPYEGQFESQSFPEYIPEIGWRATDYLVNYSWDPETRTLSSYNKGRGVGDCGSSGSWQWRDDQFVLTQFAEKYDCPDVISDDEDAEIGDFPVVFTEADGPVPATSN